MTARKPKQQVPSKLCIRCTQPKPITDFYKNVKWESQNYHDCWCSDCCDKYVVDKDSLIEYCKHNNRQWQDGFWERAQKRALYALATNNESIKVHVLRN